MKSMRSLAVTALLWLVVSARGADLAPPLLLGTNGVIRNYTNFFTANSDALVAALNAAGYSPGGTGNADTNAATAWSAQQTFLANVLFGSTNAVAKLSSLDSGKQQSDADLDALAALALTGVVVRTGSGTYALRTLTGDSELVIGDGNGVAGNPLFSISSSLTRDSELTAAIAALSTVYQASDTDLAAFAGLSTTGLIARTGSGTAATRAITGDSEIAVVNGDGVSGNPTLSIGAAIARVAAVAAGYQPLSTVLGRLAGIGLGVAGDVLYRDANGWTNLAKGADGKVLKLVAGLPAWGDDNVGAGSTGNADTNSPNAWSGLQTFNGGIDANGGTNLLGVIHVTGIESDTPLSQSIGATGGTNPESARVALGLQPDVDVQTYRLALKQLALAILASGDMPYVNASGVVTNTPSTSFGRGLLNGADAAAVRALIGAVYGAGDTMTGHLKLPTYAYDAATWTNGSRTNEAATRVDVATKIEQLAIGGSFFSSVSSDFTNAAGQLQFAPEATAGTGKLLRETAAGTNTQLAGLTDVTISTPLRGQSLVYDGTKWGNGIASALDASDYWIEHFTPIISGAAGLTEARVPFTTSQLNSGVVTMNATYAGRNGVITFSGQAATNQFTGGSIGYTTGQAVLNPTNVLQYKADIILVLTNDLWGRIGYTDQANTNDPTDALMFTTTNGVVFGMACQGGFANRTQTSTSFIASSNVWYSFRIFMTNSTAWFRIYTNQTQLAWQESITSNVPGSGQYFGPWAMAECGGAGSTNKILMGVDTFGHRFSVQ